MSGKSYLGVNDIAKGVKKIYVGVNGIAREVKKGYVGVNGIAREIYSGQTIYKWKRYYRNKSYTTSKSSLSGGGYYPEITRDRSSHSFATGCSVIDEKTAKITSAVNPQQNSYYTFISHANSTNSNTIYDWTMSGFSIVGESFTCYYSESGYYSYFEIYARVDRVDTYTVTLAYPNLYKVTIYPNYSKGSYIDDVYSTDRNAYPNNYYSDSYWYVYDGTV